MSAINKAMQSFALTIKDECTKRGYTASLCLADGLGHGEFYHNMEEVPYSMIRFFEKNGKNAIHFKSHMESKPKETNMCYNALVIVADMMGIQALGFIQACKEIEKRIEIHKEKGKIIPLNRKGGKNG